VYRKLGGVPVVLDEERKDVPVGLGGNLRQTKRLQSPSWQLLAKTVVQERQNLRDASRIAVRNRVVDIPFLQHLTGKRHTEKLEKDGDAERVDGSDHLRGALEPALKDFRRASDAMNAQGHRVDEEVLQTRAGLE